MSVSVAHKNMYDVLGNILENEEPSKPPREVIKQINTTKKREEKVSHAPESDGFTQRSGGRGGRGNRYSGNEQAFRDPDAGRENNRSKKVSEEDTAPVRSGRGGGRGSRGGRGQREFDRRSATGREDSEKQIEHAWGSNNAESEWKDEISGAEQALKESGNGENLDTNAATEPENEAVAPATEEDKTMTYDDYLAELASRQANLGPPTDIRRPNEGTRQDKKWPNAKPLSKNNEENEYITGETKDKTRNRERKTKQFVDIETRYAEPRENRRGGGGRGRGGNRGRGGRDRERGDTDRGDRNRGPRGDHYGGDRGDRGGNDDSNVNIHDSSSFPALGAQEKR